MEPEDVDHDGIADDRDNCFMVANADQRDTNGDGIGNICDADFSNDCVVDFEDMAIMKQHFYSTVQPNMDLDGDGMVNFLD